MLRFHDLFWYIKVILKNIFLKNFKSYDFFVRIICFSFYEKLFKTL